MPRTPRPPRPPRTPHKEKAPKKHATTRSLRGSASPQPVLRFTPTAWAKLHHLCHRGDTEVGGFGITDTDDPLRIVDFVTVKQRASAVSVRFDDEAVADFFDRQVDAGRQPAQFARHWIHTHPGDCPQPSGTDEHTFARVFGHCDWAVMFILAKGGQTYARLRFNTGPGGQMLIPVEVDYNAPFTGSDHGAWEAEYQANVQVESKLTALSPLGEIDLDHDELIELDPTLDGPVMQMLMEGEVDDPASTYEEELER